MAELYVGLENGQKKLIPTSSEARSGNPLGTILAIHSNAVPYGWNSVGVIIEYTKAD